MACRSGCKTQDHNSYGECLRAASLNIGYCGIGGSDYTAQKKWDADLAYYRDARRQGVQPAGTTRKKVERAMKISERTGSAFNAELPLTAQMEAY